MYRLVFLFLLVACAQPAVRVRWTESGASHYRVFGCSEDSCAERRRLGDFAASEVCKAGECAAVLKPGRARFVAVAGDDAPLSNSLAVK
jgi:hypothetical protein